MTAEFSIIPDDPTGGRLQVEILSKFEGTASFEWDAAKGLWINYDGTPYLIDETTAQAGTNWNEVGREAMNADHAPFGRFTENPERLQIQTTLEWVKTQAMNRAINDALSKAPEADFLLVPRFVWSWEMLSDVEFSAGSKTPMPLRANAVLYRATVTVRGTGARIAPRELP